MFLVIVSYQSQSAIDKCISLPVVFLLLVAPNKTEPQYVMGKKWREENVLSLRRLQNYFNPSPLHVHKHSDT